ncbi:hypothetical protein FHS29_000067 [Saccharothrix tamanrassetensis]|uniref:Secreted protein n=1 Tax=Saccharothrix tamanrassetensis TaxID=1051531 RepID=A0A841CBE5_9PSEU|nr:hypothetical protein [Saccharothrix tamanrassetensis]MBB5953497.1 hypothetical protein [Saccharothrix tamanrassetensis]
MRPIRPAVLAGGLAAAAVLAVPTPATAAAVAEEIPRERVLFQTTDEDNVPHMKMVLCGEATGPTTYQLTAQLLTPGEEPPVGLCQAHAITDIPGARELLDKVHLDPDGTHGSPTRAEDDFDSHEVYDATDDEPKVTKKNITEHLVRQLLNQPTGLIDMQEILGPGSDQALTVGHES